MTTSRSERWEGKDERAKNTQKETPQKHIFQQSAGFSWTVVDGGKSRVGPEHIT